MTGMSVMIKSRVAYLNYSHMHACDNYYTKCTYIQLVFFNKIYKSIKEIYIYICCAYILQ